MLKNLIKLLKLDDKGSGKNSNNNDNNDDRGISPPSWTSTYGCDVCHKIFEYYNSKVSNNNDNDIPEALDNNNKREHKPTEENKKEENTNDKKKGNNNKKKKNGKEEKRVKVTQLKRYHCMECADYDVCEECLKIPDVHHTLFHFNKFHSLFNPRSHLLYLETCDIPTVQYAILNSNSTKEGITRKDANNKRKE